MGIAKKSTKRLGELLVERGLLTPMQLEIALKEQRTNGEFLGAVLLKRRYISEDVLLKTLAEQYGLAYGHLKEHAIDWSVAKQFSVSLLVEHDCFPVAADEGSITVAMANPLDVWVVSELEKVAGLRRIKLMLAPRDEIRTVVARYQQQAVKILQDLLDDDNPR